MSAAVSAQDVRQILASKGRATIVEIAEALGIPQGDVRWTRINQSLSAGVGKWSERVGRGEYISINGTAPTPTATTASEFRPLIDNLSDEEFDRVGLTYVARTQDGAFICTDQHGVAWRVEVTVTARLI